MTKRTPFRWVFTTASTRECVFWLVLTFLSALTDWWSSHWWWMAISLACFLTWLWAYRQARRREVHR